MTSPIELDFTTRTNRTNRLHNLDEYYNNVTTDSMSVNQSEETATMEIKAVVVIPMNTSSSDETNQINLNNIEPIGKK